MQHLSWFALSNTPSIINRLMSGYIIFVLETVSCFPIQASGSGAPRWSWYSTIMPFRCFTVPQAKFFSVVNFHQYLRLHIERCCYLVWSYEIPTQPNQFVWSLVLFVGVAVNGEAPNMMKHQACSWKPFLRNSHEMDSSFFVA